MALTENQKANIQKLSVEDCIEILYECRERLGLVSQAEYKEIMCWNKSRQSLVNDLKSGKIKSVEFGKIKYPIINDK